MKKINSRNLHKVKIFSCFIFLFFLLYDDYIIIFDSFLISKNKKELFIIEVDISGSKIGNGGPSKLVQGIKDILPYNTNRCTFIPLKNIFHINKIHRADYFFLPYPEIKESFYDNLVIMNKTNKILIGPCFVPSFWKSFPDNSIWKEKRFLEILNNVKGIVVHSNRVRDYLAQKSNSSQDNMKKFKIARPCTNLKPNNINSFKNRENDIIFFEKYADLNRKNQADKLLELFRHTSLKIEILAYGNYTESQMKYLASNSKYIIYFSFYDTGAIGLKEIQNYGVFAFSHQKEFVIDKNTSFFIPELTNEFDMKPAYNKIMRIIEIISASEPNMTLIAKKNQEINKCEKTLDDLCDSIL